MHKYTRLGEYAGQVEGTVVVDGIEPIVKKGADEVNIGAPSIFTRVLYRKADALGVGELKWVTGLGIRMGEGRRVRTL